MQQGWPVLTYHLVDPYLQDQNAVTPHQFAQQIDGLLEKGLVFQSIDELYAAHVAAVYQEHEMILALDDAYLTTLEYAFPILAERNIPFLLFVPVDHVGRNNLWNPKARYIRQHLSWGDLRLLQKELGTIGSHGCSHQSLVKFDPGRIEDELIRSKTELENRLGHPVHYVAYPYGDVNRLVEETASRHYRLGFSATQGSWSWRQRPWAINRILVSRSDSVASVLQKIRCHETKEADS